MKHEYTDKDIKDIIRCKNDPIYFIETHCKIQHPVKGVVDFILHDYQRNYINCIHNNRITATLMARQLGKTAVGMAYVLWFSLFKHDQCILVAAKSGNDSADLAVRYQFMYDNLPDKIKSEMTVCNKRSKQLANGSRVIFSCVTCNTGRGHSISLLYIDEFAFVDKRIADEFWMSIHPTISCGGKAIVTSTAGDTNHIFYDIFHGLLLTDISDEGAFFADWSDHPDRDQAWADVEKSRIPELAFKQEHENQFRVV